MLREFHGALPPRLHGPKFDVLPWGCYYPPRGHRLHAAESGTGLHDVQTLELTSRVTQTKIEARVLCGQGTGGLGSE